MDSMDAAKKLGDEFGEVIRFADARNMVEQEAKALREGKRNTSKNYMASIENAYELIRSWILQAESFTVKLEWEDLASYVASHRISGTWAICIGRSIAQTKREQIQKRLEYLRGELRAERISYGELAELQSLAEHIAADDTELLEAAGVPEGGK